MHQVQQFAQAAQQFCAWAESAPASPETEAVAALQHLSRLYQRALVLPPVFGDEAPRALTHDAWAQVYRRFGALPFHHYAQCFDPSEPPTEAGVADLADDLADIWRDLKPGLCLHEAGYTDAAVWNWRQSFMLHWGRHAAGAIHALHVWHVQHVWCAND